MKKIAFLLLIIIVVIVAIIGVNIYNNNVVAMDAKKINKEFDVYNKDNVLGIDLITVINKAVDNNEKFNIEKNDKDRYIENDDTSIKIQIIMKSNEVTYDMEQIYKLGSDKFISNFGDMAFNCVSLEYHSKNGRISKMIFESIE